MSSNTTGSGGYGDGGYGGGIYAESIIALAVTDSEIAYNTSDAAGSVYITGDVEASLKNSTFSHNQVANGGGIFNLSSLITLTHVSLVSSADCSESLDYGSAITLTATTETGSTFAGWSGACSGAGDCVITIA